MILPMNELDLRLFSRDGRVLSAEASTVRFRSCERIFDDACDVGIRIRGREKSVTFHLEREVRNAEDEVVAWVFRPISSIRDSGGIEKVEIFND